MRADREPISVFPHRALRAPTAEPDIAAVDLYWLPLGAGGNSVRINGRIFEALAALLDRRERCDLYHSALVVYLPDERFVIEMAPAWSSDQERGVVAEGAVGTRTAGRFRLFRYEVRCWREGVIPDIAEAVENPHCLSTDPAVAQRVLDLTPHTPVPVWGRDELHAGEMWNSNSLTSWLIARSGLDVDAFGRRPAEELPAGGPASNSRGGRPAVDARVSTRRPARPFVESPRHVIPRLCGLMQRGILGVELDRRLAAKCFEVEDDFAVAEEDFVPFEVRSLGAERRTCLSSSCAFDLAPSLSGTTTIRRLMTPPST